MSYLPEEDNVTEEDNEINSEAVKIQETVTEESDSELDNSIVNTFNNEAHIKKAFDSEAQIVNTFNNEVQIDNVFDNEDLTKDTFEKQDLIDNSLTNYEPIELSDEIISNTPKKKRFAKSLIYDLIFYAVLIFACLYIIPNFVLQRTIVDGASMENTLMDREQLYVEKLSYHFDALKRYDIIVFYPYGRDSDDYYVKRIIGLPGEKVQIIGSNIYINDEILKEDYGKEPIENPGRAAAPVYLGDDEYFVMGDNRNMSKDSRNSEVGSVKKENIGGRVILRIYPFSKFGFVD